jgi:small-conductance mechanosensitive channel
VTSSFYKWLARLIVQTMDMRYGREIRIAAGVGAALAALGVVAYLATRGNDEAAGLSE